MKPEEREISTNLTISDMKIINNVIDLVSSKGLIKAADFTLLGNIYDKIANIVKQVDNEQNQ